MSGRKETIFTKFVILLASRFIVSMQLKGEGYLSP